MFNAGLHNAFSSFFCCATNGVMFTSSHCSRQVQDRHLSSRYRMSHFSSWGVQLESNTVVDFSLDATSSFCCMADRLSSSFTRKEKQLYRPTCSYSVASKEDAIHQTKASWANLNSCQKFSPKLKKTPLKAYNRS